VGVGDDAAVIQYGELCQVVTTDMLIEGVHFDLVYTPLRHLGYKAVVVNLSDIYAMNAAPRQVTVSIAVSGKFTVEAVEQIYEGVKLACEKYHVDLVGGDTSASVTGLFLTITALGTVSREDLTLRSGAKVNNLICVTGDLGASYMGLKVLEREKMVHRENPDIQPVLKGYDYILERFLKPEVRIDVLVALRDAGVVPTSMIDISDGLSSELLHICKQSRCGCQIYQDRIPIAEETVRSASEFNLEPLIPALNGGEDYEMLFTVPLSAHEKVTGIPGVHIIGNITDMRDHAVLVTNEGNVIKLEAQGWNAYREND